MLKGRVYKVGVPQGKYTSPSLFCRRVILKAAVTMHCLTLYTCGRCALLFRSIRLTSLRWRPFYSSLSPLFFCIILRSVLSNVLLTC